MIQGAAVWRPVVKRSGSDSRFCEVFVSGSWDTGIMING